MNGKWTVDVLWSTAAGAGGSPGANIAGAGLTYVKSIPFNVTQLAGLKVTIVGASAAAAMTSSASPAAMPRRGELLPRLGHRRTQRRQPPPPHDGRAASWLAPW